MVCRHWQVQREVVQLVQALREQLRQLQPLLRVADSAIHLAFIQVALQVFPILVTQVQFVTRLILLVLLFLYVVDQGTQPVVFMELRMVVLPDILILVQLVHYVMQV